MLSNLINGLSAVSSITKNQACAHLFPGGTLHSIAHEVPLPHLPGTMLQLAIARYKE